MKPEGATQVGHRISVWLKLLLGLFAVLLGVMGILYVMGELASSKWQRYTDSIRASTQPVTMVEIEAMRPTVPPDRNGALVVSDNFDELESLTSGVDIDVLVFGSDGQKYDFFSGIPRKTIEPSRAFRESKQALIDDLARLHNRPHGRFEIKHEPNPLSTLLPHLAPARAAAKLLRLDSMLKVMEGDLDGAVEDAVLQFKLAGTLHTEPSMISRLVQIAIEALGLRTIEQILRAAELTESQLLRLEEAVAGRLADQSIKWVLWAERAFTIETLEQIALGKLSVNTAISYAEGGAAGFRWIPTWIVRQNQLQAAKMYGSLIEASDDPDALIATARQLEVDATNLSVKYTLVKIMVPGLTRAMELHIRVAAELECARAALAAERFRLREGRFPGSLEELVPEYLESVPIDPFDGGPLRLAIVEQGIVIYSIAENKMDDGGVVERKVKRGPSPDVGFRLVLPEQRGVLILDEPSE
jgi:hypothetical protein